MRCSSDHCETVTAGSGAAPSRQILSTQSATSFIGEHLQRRAGKVEKMLAHEAVERREGAGGIGAEFGGKLRRCARHPGCVRVPLTPGSGEHGGLHLDPAHEVAALLI